MILGFRHRGLRRLYEDNNSRGVSQDQVRRLRRLLSILDVASGPEDLSFRPGDRFHALHGNLDGFFAVNVTGNWRLIFRFEGDDVTDVDLVDDH